MDTLGRVDAGETTTPAEAPFLSIIIPAYNEERRLPASLDSILAYLAEQPYAAEVIVVENGSSDGTVAVVEQYRADHPSVYLMRAKMRGKGNAVREGMAAARGQWLFMADADLAMPITELGKFFPPQGPRYDVAIASREAPGAVRYNEPKMRHVMGRVFNALVRILAIPRFQDTQCGFKCFRRDVAAVVFAEQTLIGWGFDVEVLYIALKKGYKVVEIPVDWYYQSDSRVRPVQDTLRMVRELLLVRWNDLRGVYSVAP
ncbi:MAG: dolichyl-phosphate beta-glucosyltransferase [Anaerolineae bacterium]